MRFLFATLMLALGLAAADAPKPNIILINCDDLGYADIGPFGSKLHRTPNLDRMSAEGVRLDSFYSSANICTAARGGLLTGRYPIRLAWSSMWRGQPTTSGLPTRS